MELAFELDIWHRYVQKRKHLGALKANTLPVLLELVLSIGLLNECLWLSYVPTLESILAPKALYIIIESHHCLHGIDI